MNADSPDALFERVRGIMFEVSRDLGAGFFEKVHQCAPLRAFGLRGNLANGQAPLSVSDEGHGEGEFFAGILVEEALVVEPIGVERLADYDSPVKSGPIPNRRPSRSQRDLAAIWTRRVRFWKRSRSRTASAPA